VTVEYTWRDDKDAKNRQKHGLPLSAGIAALEDINRESWVQDTNRWTEERMITLGIGPAGILFVVTVEYTEDHIHIISARKAEKHEERWYYEGGP